MTKPPPLDHKTRYHIIVQQLRALRPHIKGILFDQTLSRPRMIYLSVLDAAIDDILKELHEY